MKERRREGGTEGGRNKEGIWGCERRDVREGIAERWKRARTNRWCSVLNVSLYRRQCGGEKRQKSRKDRNIVQHFWPTVLSVEPLVQYLVCLSSVVCL